MNATCGVCGRPALEDMIDAGGDIAEWDAHQEALEHMLGSSFGFPHQAEDAADSELDGIDPARAITRWPAFKRTGSRTAACTSLHSARFLEQSPI
jgi:hypothetical protein